MCIRDRFIFSFAMDFLKIKSLISFSQLFKSILMFSTILRNVLLLLLRSWVVNIFLQAVKFAEILQSSVQCIQTLKLIEVFKELMESHNSVTVREEQGYLNNLENFTLVFFLSSFQHIFQKINLLFNILQKQNLFIVSSAIVRLLNVLLTSRT